MSSTSFLVYRSSFYRLNALSILQRSFNTGEYPFKIPAPIKRSPTDLLQALADTVNTDETAPNFAYIDNPYTIPSTLRKRKEYLLAKEYGRRTALRLVEEWPTLFMLDRDQPRLGVFRPQKPLNPELVEPTEQNLLYMISTRKVTDALKLYERMGEETENLEINTKMDLFKLLCYYNEEGVPLEEFEWDASRIYFSQTEERKNTEWKGLKEDGPCLAEQLFDILPKTDETYSYLICGLCKFPSVYSISKAKVLYREMVSSGFAPFEEVFNLMIKNDICLDEDVKSDLKLDTKFDSIFWLKEMSKFGVRPSVTTFNFLFQKLAKNSNSKDPKTQNLAENKDFIINKKNCWNSAGTLINEMNALNIELSLTIYSIMMKLSPNNIKFRVALLNEIFTNLEEKLVNSEIKNTDKDDPEFFKNCLLIASVAQSESLLDRMMEIYNHRNNRVKIVSPSDEARFFENYLSSKLCCLTLNNFLIVYKKFVPNLLAFSPFLFGFITRIMHDRKPDEFSWPMLKRLTEDFVNSHCFSVTKCQTVILNHLLQVKPNKHLSRTESEEYFTLCNRLIKNIADDEQFHAMKEKYKRNIKINNNNKQNDEKEMTIQQNVLSNEFYVEN